MEGRCVEKVPGVRRSEVPSGNVGSSRKATLHNAWLMAHRQRSLKRSQRRENHAGNRENDGLRFHTALAFYHLGHC